MTRLTQLLILCLALFSHQALASVLAIDYGSDWIKASLMSPGVPFDVLLDRSSKRKIQSSIGWKKEDRVFGTDAAAISGRFPSDYFTSLKYLQGVPFESPPVPYYKSISTADIIPSERGTVSHRRSDGSEWSNEELIAMQLAYVRGLAEEAANGEKVTDVVLTVPPYYTQHERDAVVDAVELAGMRTLALIHDGAAVGINYAMTRTFESEPEYHVIYDAGAGSVRATVLGFNAIPDAKSGAVKNNSPIQITAKGAGWDRSIGGTELDRRLRDLLANDFSRRYKKDIRTDKKGMAKLWKEAGRVKAILSANADAMSSVESLAFDIDYRSKITRAEFENACKDLKLRFAKPIFDSLANAGLSLDNITSVILTGGASRTPMIQAAVKAAVGESKIALNVNADEAAVLGAALHAASLSRQFKTKDIRVADISPYDIQVSYISEGKSAGKAPKTINTLVFPAGSKHGSKKTLTFRRRDDFTLKLAYKGSTVSGFPADLLEAEITGIPEALRNLTTAGAVDPVVKATLTLSESGFASVVDVVAYGEIKDDSFTGKLKSLLNSQSPLEKEQETDATDKETTADKEKKAAVKDTIPLELNIKLSSIPPMSVAQKRAARDRLQAIDRAEGAKRRREEARNTLEGYLYRVRDLLDEEGETPFRKCSQQEERQKMAEKLDETFEWLSMHGEDADTKSYIEKRTALEKLEFPITHRYQEVQEFPKALNNSQMWNWSTRLFLTEAKTTLHETPESSKYTKEELEALEKALKEHEVWLNEMVERQKRKAMNEDPAVESKELYAKAKVLEEKLQRLVKKKVPKKKATSSSGSSSGSGSSSTGSGSRTSTAGEGGETVKSRHEEL